MSVGLTSSKLQSKTDHKLGSALEGQHHVLIGQAHTNTHNRFTVLLDAVRDYPGEVAPERYNQEGKTNLDLLEQEIVSGSDISWAICKSAP